jgi:GLPGLI family protein
LGDYYKINMKTIVAILLLIMPILAKSQFGEKYIVIDTVQYIVTYSLKYQEDSLNPNFKMHEDMLLLVGKKVSMFQSYNLFIGDSMFRTIKTQEAFQRIVNDPVNPLPRVRIQYQIIKNNSKDLITTYDHIIGGSFRYDEALSSFNWHLGSGYSNFHGYNIQNASCSFGGRNWEAWFSPDIPIVDGPYKFTGLPGLILKLSDEDNHYEFEFVSLQRPNYQMVIDLRDKEYIRTTKHEFLKAVQNSRKDIILRAQEAGLSAEAQQAAARNMARRNNPIELD